MALAAEAAGTPSPTSRTRHRRHARDGAPRSRSKGLLEDGEDIDYNGVSGDIDMDDVGDPTQVRYTIAQYQDSELVVLTSEDVTVGEAELEAGEGGQPTTSTTAPGVRPPPLAASQNRMSSACRALSALVVSRPWRACPGRGR